MTNPHVVVKARDVDLVVNGETLEAGHGREIPMSEARAAVVIARADAELVPLQSPEPPYNPTTFDVDMNALELEGHRVDVVALLNLLKAAEENPNRAFTLVVSEGIVVDVVAQEPPATADETEQPDSDRTQERRAKAGTFTDRDRYDPKAEGGWRARATDPVADAAPNAPSPEPTTSNDKPAHTPPASRKRHKG